MLTSFVQNYRYDPAIILTPMFVFEQNTVGTTVKTSEEDDPIGVITALNIQRYHKLSCLKEVCQFLLKQCQEEQLKAKLQEVRRMHGSLIQFV